MYVLIRTSDGAYVAPAGQPASYTRALQLAQTYATREQAERQACGNERAVTVSECFTFRGAR